MPKNVQQQTQKQSEEAKSCMQVQNEKAIENKRKNAMKSQTEQENKKCHNFVIFNKRKASEKLGRNMLDNIEVFRNQGFTFDQL